MSMTYEMYEFRKLLKELRQKRGRGTELISLYIPPGRQISDVMRYLRKEYDQAGNIKDKLTRKNVQSALESIMQRLKLYRKTPPNGLAIFCGAIPQGSDRGTEKIEIYVVEPPEPVPSFRYVCDHEFFLEPLEDMAREKKVYGLIVMDRGGGLVALLRGSTYQIVEWVTSDIPPKHSAGGQSQRRFERIREERVHDFFKRLGLRASRALLPYLEELEGVIIGGPGDAREKFAEGNYLDYRLQQRILANVPLSYTEEQGLRELIFKAQDYIKEASLYEERRKVERLLTLLATKPGMVAYGVEEVVKALRMGAAEEVLVLEDLNFVHVTRRCSNCGYEESELRRVDQKPPETWVCPSCGATSYTEEETHIIEYVGDLAKSSGAQVSIVNPESEWGEQLASLGGIAAILRYELPE